MSQSLIWRRNFIHQIANTIEKNEGKKRTSAQPLDNQEYNQMVFKKTAQGMAGNQMSSSKADWECIYVGNLSE